MLNPKTLAVPDAKHEVAVLIYVLQACSEFSDYCIFFFNASQI